MLKKLETTNYVEYKKNDKCLVYSDINPVISKVKGSIEITSKDYLSQTNWSQDCWIQWDGNRSYLPQHDHWYDDEYEEAENLYQRYMEMMAETCDPEIDPEELRAHWEKKEGESVA
jgi:hypothetical protein